MLLEFQKLEERDPRAAARVTQAIAHLLRHQFIHTEDRGSPQLMEVLRRPAMVTLISDYFDVAGYRLVVREAEGWAGILPDTERIGLPRMRLDDTIVLLLLRRIWEEGVQDGDVEAQGSVLTSLNAAYDAYQASVAASRRASLSVSDFRNVIANFERRALVRLGEYEDDAQDMELLVRPIVAVVAGDDFATSLEQLLHRGEASADDNGQDSGEHVGSADT